MKQLKLLIAVGVCAILALPHSGTAQTGNGTPPAITTPDRVDTRIGPLDFQDGAPIGATLDKVYDNLDFTHAFRAFVDTLQGVALHKGLLSAGVKDNEVIVFSELMHAKSLFLTANADTVYAFGVLDLTKGPVVLEVPPKFLGAIDDYWFRWVTDIGAPGGDRGEGGKYLIMPPGYDGPTPDGGFFVGRARTTRVIWFGRAFLENKNDPKPCGRLDQEVHQSVLVRARRPRYSHRRVPGRQGPAWTDHTAAADALPRRQRQSDEHHPPKRLQLLRAAQ
jgi:hypothetical protein